MDDGFDMRADAPEKFFGRAPLVRGPRAVAAAAALLVGLSSAWFGCARFRQIDRCLDDGAVFDYVNRTCLLGPEAPNRLPVPEHALSAEIAFMCIGALLVFVGLRLAASIRRGVVEHRA